MIEAQAQVVLAVRAFEESDRDGRLLSPYARSAATRRALRVTGLARWPQDLADAESPRYGETVFRRARVLFDTLERRMPGLRGTIGIARLGASTAPSVIAAAMVVGLLASTIGARHRFQLLALPMLALFAWNLLAYLALAARFAWPGSGAVRWLAGLFLRGALWRRLHGWSVARRAPEEWKTATVKALMRFTASWHRVAGDLLEARVRRTLHLGAAALAIGAVLGLWVRGVTLDYPATWDNPWLGASAARRLVGIVLGPAAAAFGAPVLRLPAAEGGDAVAWVELYAAAALLYVVLPRGTLALIEGWRCRRLANLRIDLRDTYFRRVFTQWRGETRHVVIVPYGFAPSPPVLTALRSLLHESFGARAEIRVSLPLPAGTPAAALDSIPRSPRDPWSRTAAGGVELSDPERESCHVVVFDPSQAPAPGVHGRFVTGLVERVASTGGRVLVALDASPRDEPPAAAPVDARLASWRGVIAGAGPTPFEFDPRLPVDDDSVRALCAALWPPGDDFRAPAAGSAS